MSQLLWKSSHPRRFFLLPDDFTPPAGGLIIRSLTGERRRVDPAAIAPYERTQEQATEWMEGKVGQALAGVRGWFDQIADRLTGADEEPLGALREAVDRAQHLAWRIADAPSRFQQPADVQTIRSLVARLRHTAEGLEAAVIRPAR